jgi:hypothetical protein
MELSIVRARSRERLGALGLEVAARVRLRG